jgi:hypothetical protein
MPQATIKLQPAPAAAARKVGDVTPVAAASVPATVTAAKTFVKPDSKAPQSSANPAEASDEDIEAEEESTSSSDLPLPLVIGVAALALVAFGIQLWTFLA